MRFITILDCHDYARQQPVSLAAIVLTLRFVLATVLAGLPGLTRHTIVKMKSFAHPRLVNEALERIGEVHELGFDDVRILHLRTRKSQVAN